MLDLNKPLQTRDGRKIVASVVFADRIVGAIDCKGGTGIFIWNADGSHSRKGPHDLDLVNVPPLRVNVDTGETVKELA